jgi:hypothetical protein
VPLYILKAVTCPSTDHEDPRTPQSQAVSMCCRSLIWKLKLWISLWNIFVSIGTLQPATIHAPVTAGSSIQSMHLKDGDAWGLQKTYAYGQTL